MRVHERAPTLRPGGFGLAVHANGVRVLKALRAFDLATVSACRFGGRETRDGANQVTSRLRYKNSMYRCARRQIIEALQQRALESGVEIVTNSEVVQATAEGSMVMADGRRIEADLVVAADGVNSRLRDSLGLLDERQRLPDGAMRLMISRIPDEIAGASDGTSIEYWSKARRLIYSPCSKTELYIALSCLASDELGQRVPIDVESWENTFPAISHLIRRIRVEAPWDRVQWVPFQVIRLKSWSVGRAAVVGDAAHAMAPNLGQGALCAMMNGLALAVALSEKNSVEEGLQLWERRERPLIEHTQRMSSIYGAVTSWPSWLRSATFWLTSNVKWLNWQFIRTAEHIPTGAALTEEGSR